jgi:hypothetical protein
MTTLTVYGQWATYDEATKKVETRLGKFVVELMDEESWKAPTGFNVTTVRLNERQ